MGRRTALAAGPAVAVLLCAACVGVLTGCTGAPERVRDSHEAPSDPAGRISVRAGDALCELSAAEAPAGTLTFSVTNTGAADTAFALYDGGGEVVGTVVDIGPGLTRQLVVEVPDSGAYTTACRPGQVGTGIQVPFTVTAAAAGPFDTRAALAAATASYQRYLAQQLDALVSDTRGFAEAVKAGDVDRAKARYPVARAPYERFEPLVTPLGDLADRIDGQEDDERAPGAVWTGFHRLERDLWRDGLQPDSARTADQLVADVEELRTRVAALQLSPERVGGAAKELLDEVAISKLRGDEDRYSHTDLFDLAANVEGSQAAVAALRPVLDAKAPALGPLLDTRFAAVVDLMAEHRSGSGFVAYTALTDVDMKKMADAIDAVGEPVSTVAGVVSS